MNLYGLGSGAAHVQSLLVRLPFAAGQRNVPIQNHFLGAANVSDIKYADLDQSTPYSRLTLKYIGQVDPRFSLYIRCLAEIEMQPTNQGVGSSNLSGRANKSSTSTLLRQPDL
jgi:hypothetical protein